jgi:hypothetical protein
MARKLSDILNSTRQQYFVGREKELQLFKSILEQPELSTYLLAIYGPGGQGKSTLVRAFTENCTQLQIPYLILDARDINPTPDHFQALLQKMLGTLTNVFDHLQQLNSKFVLLIDTYELLTPLDDWLRTVFLPQMPDNVLTVLAGRKQPSPNWISDTGWQKLMKVVQLRNLTPTESKDFLHKRNVPETEIEKVLDFTHGHPLALSVVADMFDQNPERSFNPGEAPDIVRTLLERFSQKAPSPAHRMALEICAIANITTESLLQQAMEVEDASELFEWLQDLSFIESNRMGLYPHDSAREALCTDLAWRNPDWNKQLHLRIRKYYIKKLDTASPEEKRYLLYLLAYLHRNHPMVKPYLEWQQGTAYWIEVMKAEDIPHLEKMVEQHEGKSSAQTFLYWANHKAATVWVYRNSVEKPAGFLMYITINEIENEEAAKDEIVLSVKKYATKNLGLRKGELATVFRYWMAADTYQQVSRLQSSIFLTLTQYYFTPNLAVHFLSCVNPEFWKVLLNYADLHHVAELDYTLNKNNFGFYMHDWRQTPPAAWLEILGQREIGEKVESSIEQPRMQMMILSEDEFANSVYEALKEYQSEKKLAANPLIRSKLVLNNAEGNEETQILVAALKDCIAEACDSIKESPKEEKFFRVIFRTFINPVGSQEAAADFLNLPFSTYRRYLRKAVNLVTEYLWAKELEK